MNKNKSVSIAFNVVFVELVAISVSSIANTPMVLGIALPTYSICAKDFAPGQEKNTTESNFDSGAKAFAPGQEAKFPFSTCGSCNGKEFAPGQEKKDIGAIGQ